MLGIKEAIKELEYAPDDNYADLLPLTGIELRFSKDRRHILSARHVNDNEPWRAEEYQQAIHNGTSGSL